MFCPKCGAKVPDGAVFCPSCGAKMPVIDAPAQEPPKVDLSKPEPPKTDPAAVSPPTYNYGQAPATDSQQPTYSYGAAPAAETPKKKSKKPLIIGLIGLVAVVLIIAVVGMMGGSSGESEIDYKATVRAYAPFESTLGLSYTCGDVVDQYLDNPVWDISGV